MKPQKEGFLMLLRSFSFAAFLACLITSDTHVLLCAAELENAETEEAFLPDISIGYQTIQQRIDQNQRNNLAALQTYNNRSLLVDVSLGALGAIAASRIYNKNWTLIMAQVRNHPDPWGIRTFISAADEVITPIKCPLACLAFGGFCWWSIKRSMQRSLLQAHQTEMNQLRAELNQTLQEHQSNTNRAIERHMNRTQNQLKKMQDICAETRRATSRDIAGVKKKSGELTQQMKDFENTHVPEQAQRINDLQRKLGKIEGELMQWDQRIIKDMRRLQQKKASVGVEAAAQ
jgi:hypothetical protein